jgi:hypothetical protein
MIDYKYQKKAARGIPWQLLEAESLISVYGFLPKHYSTFGGTAG